MFSELPKLFGKNFAVGFYLPTVAIACALSGIAIAHQHSDWLDKLRSEDPLKIAALSLIGIWLFAIGLMGLYRTVIRTLEGYGLCNPLRPLVRWQRHRFDCLRRDLEAKSKAAEKARDARDDALASGDLEHQTASLASAKRRAAAAEATLEAQPHNHRVRARAVVARHRVEEAEEALRTLKEVLENAASAKVAADRRRRELVDRFPYNRHLVLPTRFGNAVRAFEVYSQVVYNLDSIPAWPRLLAVIPKDFSASIAEAEANVSFWVNLWLGGILVAAADLAWTWIGNASSLPWSWAAALLFSWLAAICARLAIADWGALVKSAFDLFRADLAKQLGMKRPRTLARERELWSALSAVMTYQQEEAAAKLNDFRKK